ncbi:MAG: sugar kinase [Alphaproteobacteria bacterium]|nr:sugar kinase [Alphaproteobacteria bacterium]
MSPARILCFGELLLRLSAPTGEKLLQSASLNVVVGGAEANVAVCLAQLGQSAALVSIVPDNALGHGARNEARKYGVDVSGLQMSTSGRMGLYFLTPGAVLRPSEVLYDRQGSAFALGSADAIEWPPLLEGADWFHISGVTPAIGAHAAAAAVRAVEAATEAGVPVSFDGNYRGKLWAQWRGDGPKILRTLFEHTALAFADERDIALVLGKDFGGDTPIERRRRAGEAAFAAFPKLHRIASTIREVHGPDDHTLTGTMLSRDGGERVTRAFRLSRIVDRIGGGDAFAAGLLCGLSEGKDDAASLDLAMACASLKHGVFGDFHQVARSELDDVLEGGGGDVRR